MYKSSQAPCFLVSLLTIGKKAIGGPAASGAEWCHHRNSNPTAAPKPSKQGMSQRSWNSTQMSALSPSGCMTEKSLNLTKPQCLHGKKKKKKKLGGGFCVCVWKSYSGSDKSVTILYRTNVFQIAKCHALMLLSIRLLLSLLWGKLFLKEETMQAYLWHVNNQKQPSTGLCPWFQSQAGRAGKMQEVYLLLHKPGWSPAGRGEFSPQLLCPGPSCIILLLIPVSTLSPGDGVWLRGAGVQKLWYRSLPRMWANFNTKP